MLNLQGLSIKHIQVAIQILGVLKNAGIKDIDSAKVALLEYVQATAPGVVLEEKIKRRKYHTTKQVATPKLCEKCGSLTSAAPVNVSKCTVIEGGWNTVLVCTDVDCMHTMYFKETITELKNLHKDIS